MLRNTKLDDVQTSSVPNIVLLHDSKKSHEVLKPVPPGYQ